NLQIAIRKMPCNDDWIGPLFTRKQCSVKQKRTSVTPVRIDVVGSFVCGECGCREFTPQSRQRIELPSGTPQPHAFNTRYVANRKKTSTAIGLGMFFFNVVQKHATIRNHGIPTGCFVLATSRCEVCEMVRKLVVHYLRRSVVQRVFEYSARNS